MAKTLYALLAPGAVGVVIAAIAPASYAASLGGYDFGTGPGTLAPTGVVSGVSFSNFAYTGNDTNTSLPSGNGAGKGFRAQDFSNDSSININSTGDPDGFFSFTRPLAKPGKRSKSGLS